MKAVMTARPPADDRPRTREDRLAAALRANLRRRKAASRKGEEGAERGKKALELRDSASATGRSGDRS
jgi:hypothetical protein